MSQGSEVTRGGCPPPIDALSADEKAYITAAKAAAVLQAPHRFGDADVVEVLQGLQPSRERLQWAINLLTEYAKTDEEESKSEATEVYSGGYLRGRAFAYRQAAQMFARAL